MIRTLLSLLTMVSLANAAFSQTYPNDREKFVKQLSKVLSEYGSGEHSRFVKHTLEPLLLESGDFPEAYFSRMVQTCNTFEEKRLKVFPEIYNYVYSFSSLVLTKQSKESYEAWHNTVDEMLGSRNVKKIKEFTEFSAGFFSEGMISESSNFKWFYFGGSYSFSFNKEVSIRFEGGNLICRAIGKSGENRGKSLDSLVIINTSGTYDPDINKWVGRNGRITWEKVGLDPSTNFADIQGYSVSLKSSTLRVDTASLTTSYFDKPIQGILTDRAFKVNREVDKIYPQFLSFDRELLIPNVVENVDYTGGFTLQGNTFIGVGTQQEPAQITLKKEGVPFVNVRAKMIRIMSDKVSADRGALALYMNNGDSLSHPGAMFNYYLDKKEVHFSRAKKGIGEAPFNDSYHKLDIYVPRIIWTEGDDHLYFTYEFGSSREQRYASFESQNYFDEKVYDQLQGMEARHPLVAIWDYCYRYDEYVLSEGKAATALGRTVDQAKATLLKLSSMGFISYDSEADRVSVNPKLENFVRAKAGKKDYDNIVFTSDFREKTLSGFTEDQIRKDPYLTRVTEEFKRINKERELIQNFAVFDINTMELSIEAVDKIVVSERKNLIVFPENGRVKVYENRDFVFSGWVNAGKAEINAVLADFEYDSYKIKLQKTEECIFRIRPLDKTHGTKGIAMQSSLNGLTGEILIDDPSNKSGINPDFGMYPKLNSITEAKIYYNSKEIYRGAYDSTRFYYTLKPFLRDSLNTFSEKNFRLEGELVSAGIFPKLNEPLKIMQDYSFGFSMMAPEGGLTFYGADAKYKNKIVLSNNGLQGTGTINYIQATAESKALTFLPDSTVGYGTFTNSPVETGVQFPDVTSESVLITYVPSNNVLKASSTPESDLAFFNKEVKLRGTVFVRPDGMKGTGLMAFKKANLIAKEFRYTRYDVKSDASNFQLKNDHRDSSENALTMETKNVAANVSLKDRVGVFTSNGGTRRIDFHVNQFYAKMDKTKWFMDDEFIELENTQGKASTTIETGVDLVGSNFFSTNLKQDSLNFRSAKAIFDNGAKAIYCSSVEYIDVADARIYPDSMRVNIRKKAKLDKLQNATIVANYVTKYHKFDDANVEINARRDYKASGRYPYYDVDSSLSYIVMEKIGLDTSYQTIAKGKILKEDNFKLSPEFDFYGEVAIHAANPLINFSGVTRINHTCEKFERNWMSFRSEIDPKNIQIPVSNQMKDLEGNPISAGIVWRNSPSLDSLKMYPTFLSALVDPNDPIAMTSSGYLQYDTGTKEFQISSREKLLDRGEKGNYIALHTETCSMNGDGNVDLGMEYGDVDVDAVGIVNYDQNSGKTSMNLTMRFNMEIDKGTMGTMARKINEMEGLQPMDFASNTLEQAVLEWDGRKEADKFKEEYIQEGKVKKLPNGLQNTLTFSGIHLSSYTSDKDERKGLITDINTAVLVGIYGTPVLKYVPFNGFFQQTYSELRNDKFMLFIDIPAGRDYYFQYEMVKKEGTMYVYTGDAEMKGSIDTMKEDKRKKKNFSYTTTSNSAFLSKFKGLFE